MNDGLARTEDGLLEGDYRDLAIDPNDPEVVYAAHGIIGRPASGCMTLASADSMRVPKPAARMIAAMLRSAMVFKSLNRSGVSKGDGF